jgi:hypothetical protein
LDEIQAVIDHIEAATKQFEQKRKDIIANSDNWKTLDRDFARIDGQQMAYLDVLKKVTELMRQGIENERNRKQVAGKATQESSPQG